MTTVKMPKCDSSVNGSIRQDLNAENSYSPAMDFGKDRHNETRSARERLKIHLPEIDVTASIMDNKYKKYVLCVPSCLSLDSRVLKKGERVVGEGLSRMPFNT